MRTLVVLILSPAMLAARPIRFTGDESCRIVFAALAGGGERIICVENVHASKQEESGRLRIHAAKSLDVERVFPLGGAVDSASMVGQHLAVVQGDRLSLWEPQSGRKLCDRRVGPAAMQSGHLILEEGKKIQVSVLKSGCEMAMRCSVPASTQGAVAVSRSGGKVATLTDVGNDSVVKVYSPKGDEIRRFGIHKRTISSLQLSSNGDLVCWSSYNAGSGQCVVRRVSDGREMLSLRHKSVLPLLLVESQLVVSCGIYLDVWSVNDGQRLLHASLGPDTTAPVEVDCVVLDPTRKRVFIAGRLVAEYGPLFQPRRFSSALIGYPIDEGGVK